MFWGKIILINPHNVCKSLVLGMNKKKKIE